MTQDPRPKTRDSRIKTQDSRPSPALLFNLCNLRIIPPRLAVSTYLHRHRGSSAKGSSQRKPKDHRARLSKTRRDRAADTSRVANRDLQSSPLHPANAAGKLT